MSDCKLTWKPMETALLSTVPQILSEVRALRGDGELRRAVRAMTGMLDDSEWAEHVSQDPDAMALEAAITVLHGDLAEAQERVAELEEQLAALQGNQ